MTDRLVVVLEGRQIGALQRNGRSLRLQFEGSYTDAPDATPLSVAMPSSIPEHGDRVLTAWLWGILPDNADVLARWGREFAVSVSSPFGLLSTQVGHDCPGAVQFCSREAADEIIDREGEVERLSTADVAYRLRTLRGDSASWLGPGTTGQFSLAGAQPKTALHRDASGWGLPSGSAPTTHILKPAIVGLDHHDLNEHLCLAAASICGLRAARSSVEQFEDQTAICVERFDRREVDGRLVRIHQEDLCQALGLPPTRKYQSDGGPSIADIARLLRSVMPSTDAVDAVDRFLDALAFNWLVAGTDGHSKNYSLLHSGNQTRLAPLYDLASALPYDTSQGHKLKLAMRLGNEYRLRATDRPSTWRRVAADIERPPEAVVDRVARLAAVIGPAFECAAADLESTGIRSPLPPRLVAAVAHRASHCQQVLA